MKPKIPITTINEDFVDDFYFEHTYFNLNTIECYKTFEFMNGEENLWWRLWDAVINHIRKEIVENKT